MADITINGTVVSLPASSASPNWAPALIQALELTAAAFSGITGDFDVAPQTLNIAAYDAVTDQDVTGLSFSTAAVRSAVITYSVYRTSNTPANASESGQIFIDYNTNRGSGLKWALSRECIGDANITFSITDSGQVQFTTTTIGGASHAGRISFFAKATEQT